MDDVDLSTWTLDELYVAQERIHTDLVKELQLAGKELKLSFMVASVTFLFPITLINKYVYTRLTKRRFETTTADIIDFTIFVLVAIWYESYTIYSSKELDFPLFGPEEDSIFEVRLMRSIIYDIENDIFHMDFLLAAITALLWFRCILLLKLSEQFGPLLAMIYAMLLIFTRFIVLYVIELVTFSCISALTMSENPNFSNLFNAFRTYLSASLGEFDLHQYDEYPGFKGNFGLFMHILVLFVNMILIINLLIAFMSDTYARMASVRIGLYWSSVIKEMPKFAYDKHYGVLVMFPFLFSYIGFLVLPCFVLIKDKKKLAAVNELAFKIFYFPISLVVLSVFMAVNLILLPIAYGKTLIHKIVLYRRYRGTDLFKNVILFLVLGIPFLVCSQLTDVYYFMVHSFKTKQQKQQE